MCRESHLHFQIDAEIADRSQPVFAEPGPLRGYISQSSYDNGVASVVTTDEEGLKPLQLIVSDDDDEQVIICFLSKR